MRRQEMWQKQYHARRYMEHLTHEELEQRTKDILLNQLVLTENEKIGLHPINQEGEYWMVAFSDLIEEYTIRYGQYPAGIKRGIINEVPFPNPESNKVKKACNLIKKLNIPSGTCLFKYGVFKWLQQAFEKGTIRIAPASFYNDPSLNHAISDNELELSINPHPSVMNSDEIEGKLDISKGSTNFNNKIIQLSDTNYYVYCVSSVFIPRLFLDFEADACLIIKRPDPFRIKLLKAFERNCHDWTANTYPVRYIDPLNTTSDQINVFICKHFRYSYQKEMRTIWLPSASEIDLDYQYLELDNLRDCCELVQI